MYSEKERCGALCIATGYKGGKLVTDGDVCPFHYFCQCVCYSCEKKCASKGKVHYYKRDVDVHGCSICNCQCPKRNCWKTCKGNNFVLFNNTFGCLDCKCLCPDIACDKKCNGTGIIRANESSCFICDGCKVQETYSQWFQGNGCVWNLFEFFSCQVKYIFSDL